MHNIAFYTTNSPLFKTDKNKYKMKNLELYNDCFESISDPICLDCFLIQINKWLKNKPINIKTKRILITEIRKEFFKENKHTPEYEVTCVSCREKKVSTCPYCLFLKVNNLLRKMNFEKELIEEFLEIFNYKPCY
jgi:hypothetical protein